MSDEQEEQLAVHITECRCPPVSVTIRIGDDVTTRSLTCEQSRGASIEDRVTMNMIDALTSVRRLRVGAILAKGVQMASDMEHIDSSEVWDEFHDAAMHAVEQSEADLERERAERAAEMEQEEDE